MAYFPLFVDLTKKKILIAGGGNIAERRMRTILPFAGQVTVVSGSFTEGIRTLAEKNGSSAAKIILLKRHFEEADLENADLVLACTSDDEQNRTITGLCRGKGIPANNCSDKEDCDFFCPGLIYRDPFVVGFTASGKGHGQVREIRERTEKIIDDIMKNDDKGENRV